MLIGIYLFIPVINSFLKEYELKGIEYFLAIWLFFILLKTFDMYPLLPKLNLDYFTGFIDYVLLGYYLDNKQFSLSDKKMLIIGLAIFLVSLLSFIALVASKQYF